MGNSSACCQSVDTQALAAVQPPEENNLAEIVPDTPIARPVLVGNTEARGSSKMGRDSLKELALPDTFSVTLQKLRGGKLGLDVDYVRERKVLPIKEVKGGAAQAWNITHPETPLRPGDAILEVNGKGGNVEVMLEQCKTHRTLLMTVQRASNYTQLVKDLEDLIASANCGPLMIRLSWQDAGVFHRGEGGQRCGCPNAAMRFTDGGEGTFPANAGLPTVALGLLAPISAKFCPHIISHADLWALAANVAIRVMGGPEVPTHFGRVDAASSAESCDTEVGILPEGSSSPANLKSIFQAKGFNDREIVALSGAHTVGRCHLEFSGYDGAWTDEPTKFDNSYFKVMLERSYAPETTKRGCQQMRSSSGTIMLPSDLALLQRPIFRKYVELYASNESAFFEDFVDCWVRIQENGCPRLRNIL